MTTMASTSAPTTTATTVVDDGHDDGLEEYPGQRNERVYAAGTGYPPPANGGATTEIKQRLPYILNTRTFGSHLCKHNLEFSG